MDTKTVRVIVIIIVIIYFTTYNSKYIVNIARREH